MKFFFGVVILGAGASRRMGRAKLALPWGEGSTIIEHLLCQWQRAGAAQTTIVVDRENLELNNALDAITGVRLDRIENPEPLKGMFGSIQSAAAWGGWDSGLTHIVVALGDQPHLKQQTLDHLIAAGRRRPEHICQPFWNERRRHPILFPRSIFHRLATSSHPTLAHVLRQDELPMDAVPMDDSGLGLDLDTPEDYAKAVRSNSP
ncbi:MAG: nucleotidyltransferase family protein [Verrucomicrobiota bacterium]